jgi:two-component system, OmpR family, sensor histidine kinase VicK
LKTFSTKSERVKYQAAWRDYYTGLNLRAIRSASIAFLLVNLAIRLLILVFPISISHADNFPAFNYSNATFLVSAFLFFVCCNYLLKVYRKKPKATAIMALFSFSFSLYIIMCGMYSSFLSNGDPLNSLLFYVFALISMSVLCVFEYFETLLLIISSEILFTVMLFISGADASGMLTNQTVSLVLLSGFYVVSRFYFKGRLNYFLQLMELREKNLEIERASELKSQILGVVAHDLRNPIAAVETIVSMMEMDEQTDETKENIGMIKASCKKARSIIDDLLETARNEHGAEFVAVKTELNEFLSQLIEVWKVQKDAKGLMLMSEVRPAYVNINHEKFQRAVDNLIGNALKFSPEGGRVEVALRRDNTDIIVEVKDHGIGISKEKLAIIFNPFTKAGRAGLKGEPSTGLGLSIVKQIIEKHKGKVEVQSEEGKGSTFRMILPESS